MIFLSSFLEGTAQMLGPVGVSESTLMVGVGVVCREQPPEAHVLALYRCAQGSGYREAAQHSEIWRGEGANEVS